MKKSPVIVLLDRIITLLEAQAARAAEKDAELESLKKKIELVMTRFTPRAELIR